MLFIFINVLKLFFFYNIVFRMNGNLENLYLENFYIINFCIWEKKYKFVFIFSCVD